MLKKNKKSEKNLNNLLPLDKWSEFVFAHAKFIDGRLNTRLKKVAKALAKSPGDSIPNALDFWSQTKAAYNFLGNKKVCCEKILESVGMSTAQLCVNLDTVLNIQDTSSLSFSNAEKTSGLGPIYGKDTKGLHFHTSLAVSENGVPIGLFGIKIWARKYEEFGKKYYCKKKPIEEKESYKWIDGINAARESIKYISPIKKVKIIHVGDREDDIFEVLSDIISSGDGCVIRSSCNRWVFDEKRVSVKAYEHVHRQNPIGRFLVEVPRKENEKERTASLALRSCRLYLDDELKMKINLVEVLEEIPPTDVQAPLKWYLWTTENVDSSDAIIRVVNFYKHRWLIEEYHKTLKSGCRIEALQLKSAEQIKNAVAIYAAVAVRILQLAKLSRKEPDAPCTQILMQDEWQALYTIINKKPPNAATPVPTIREAHLWIGRLGGHIGRKSDGLPGIKTTWLGLNELSIITNVYRILRS